MMLVKRLFCRFVVAAISASFTMSASYSSAAPISSWVVDTASGAAVGIVYSGLATDSPVIGNGTTTNNADSGIITSSFSTISLLDGQSIILSGNMTVLGAKVAGEDVGFQFGLMYENGSPAVDTNGWLGYKIDNANAGQSGSDPNGHLRARTTSGTSFTTTTWISSGSGRDTTIATVPNSVLANGVFSDGTYSFNLTVERSGANVKVSGSILGTGATTFTNSFGPATVSAASQLTFDFNRVGLWSVSGLNAEQVSFSSMDVSVIPEPSMYLFAGLGLVGLVIIRQRRAK